jgi:hypothetical protein
MNEPPKGGTRPPDAFVQRATSASVPKTKGGTQPPDTFVQRATMAHVLKTRPEAGFHLNLFSHD